VNARGEFFGEWKAAGNDDDRYVRIAWAIPHLGRDIDSFSGLTDADFRKLTEVLRAEMSIRNAMPFMSMIVDMRGRAQKRAAPMTVRQRWKIHQIEAWLGWTRSESLDKFLKRYKVESVDDLDAKKARSVIDGLQAMAARDRLIARNGPDYKPAKDEIAAEVEAVKKELSTWRER
jgi:hypothetical protein